MQFIKTHIALIILFTILFAITCSNSFLTYRLFQRTAIHERALVQHENVLIQVVKFLQEATPPTP